MKYKVGDKVRVRRNLKEGEAYSDWIVTDDMVLFAGQVYEIVRANAGWYDLGARALWGWTEEMLEPADTDPAWRFDRPDAKKD